MTAPRIIGEAFGFKVGHALDHVVISHDCGARIVLAVALDAPFGDEACQLRDLINAARNSEAADMRARRDIGQARFNAVMNANVAPCVTRREGE